MKKALIITIAVVTGALSSNIVLAEGRGGHHQRGQHLMLMDINGDGNVTKEEINAVKSEIFAELDENGDGTVSVEEYAMLPEIKKRKHREHRFNKTDTDDNGLISNDEFTVSDEQFEKMDKNGDGVLNKNDHRQGRHNR